MLYVGATLMIGASIYGFVDYRKNSQKKEFTDLYTEVKKTEPVIPAVAVKTEPAKKEMNYPAKKNTGKKEIKATKKGSEKGTVTVPETVREKEAFVPIIGQSRDIVAGGKIALGENATPTAKVDEIGMAKVVKKKKRKLRSDLFSRAPLRDEVEIEFVPEKTDKKVSKSSKE
jgi:hypothetical protein